MTPNELTQYVYLNSILEQDKAKIMFDLQNTIVNFKDVNTPITSNEN